jgi:hypothetical protein
MHMSGYRAGDIPERQDRLCVSCLRSNRLGPLFAMGVGFWREAQLFFKE